MDSVELTGLIGKMARELELKKEKIVREKLKEYFSSIGEPMPEIEKEMFRRFPRFLKVVEQGTLTESYFWNDGSIDGKRIVTFQESEKRKELHFGFSDFKTSSTIELTYY